MSTSKGLDRARGKQRNQDYYSSRFDRIYFLFGRWYLVVVEMVRPADRISSATATATSGNPVVCLFQPQKHIYLTLKLEPMRLMQYEIL